VPRWMDEVDLAFNEWDETTPVPQLAQGSQPHMLPAAAPPPEPPRRRLARASQPMPVAQTLEEALLALTDGVPDELLD
jgi:hypothetical protein